MRKGVCCQRNVHTLHDSMTKAKKKSVEASATTEEVAAIVFETRAEGVVLPVKAQPGAGKNELRGVQDGALKVCVTQVPEKGKANKAIVEYLAKALKIRKSQISLLSGELSSQKKFLVADIDETELHEKIAAAIS